MISRTFTHTIGQQYLLYLPCASTQRWFVSHLLSSVPNTCKHENSKNRAFEDIFTDCFIKSRFEIK
nr:MAG TPA: hypothetical protein [Caudoviricetes sp.]